MSTFTGNRPNAPGPYWGRRHLKPPNPSTRGLKGGPQRRPEPGSSRLPACWSLPRGSGRPFCSQCAKLSPTTTRRGDVGEGIPVLPRGSDDSLATETLRVFGAIEQAQVQSFECAPVDPGFGMTGVLVRLSLTYDVAESDAPATLVAKFSDPDPGFRAMVHSMGFYEREVSFYSEFAADVPVAVPRCYFAGIDREEGWSLLLLEDLAAARNGSWVLGSSSEDLRVAVAAIAVVHAAWWESPRLKAADWLTMTGFLAVGQMQDVVARCWDPFLARLSVPVTPAIAEAGELASRHLQEVCAYLYETPPRTLVHHDFDGENLFFPVVAGQPPVVVLDWQLTTRAHSAIDVGWLIGGQCEPADRRKHELDLVHTYHGLLVDHGVSNYDFDRCWDDYRLSMLVAVGRTSGSVGLQPPGPRGGPWDKIVPRYCQAVCDLGVAELLATRSLRGQLPPTVSREHP